jgi:magnesium chelatase family protein
VSIPPKRKQNQTDTDFKNAASDTSGLQLLRTTMDRLSLSVRANERILKLFQTIAYLETSSHVLPVHLAEAINYRNLYREAWAG